MATKQKTKTKTRSKKITTRVERAPVRSDTNNLSTASTLIAHTRPTFPSLTEAERATYRSRFSEAQCDELGALTKSPNVVSLFTLWVPIIASTLGSRPRDIAGYGPHRFSFLLELGTDLVHAMRDQSAVEATKNRVVNATQLQRDLALATRTLLLRKLNTIAGDHPGDSAALDEATGSTADDTAIADSLRDLASLGASWLESDDHAPLVRDASLSASDLAHASDAAESLVGTSASRAEGGRRVSQDGPAVNRVEGRVLAELKVAFQVFRGAHAANRLVPVLPLVKGTSRVFEAHRAPSKDATPPTTAPAAHA